MTTIVAYLTSEYARLAYTPAYIFGYAVKGTIYAARVENADPILPYIVSLDRASSKNGGTYSIKYKPNAEKIAIINSSASEIRPICTVDYMETLKNETNQNRGQLFETMVAEAFHMQQNTAKNAKFTNAGDVIAENGTHYQVKFNKATFTDERTLHNLTSKK